ncbi:hypothetical protein RF11_01421 [Thelohanellus kitauei]|uniref:ISXO2-like transposase domain-containing protein n=1 Tax=Thelohanellus kitauei TaxID=669202 RepID=A0A0C2J2R6_THEKT|nr:hypothetical protein RF11_01421 [Thelohanellus kitauei]
MLHGDQNPSLAEINEFNLLHDDNDEDVNPLRNYGRRIEGPWIFGMAECHLIRDSNTYQTKSVRLFHAERRDASTLIPSIRDNVEAGSTIWSDRFGAYSRNSTETPRINHETVNHSVEFVATNGTHTQNIEWLWEKLKLKHMRISRGSSSNLLESHLREFMYRSRFNSRDGWIFFKIS